MPMNQNPNMYRSFATFVGIVLFTGCHTPWPQGAAGTHEKAPPRAGRVDIATYDITERAPVKRLDVYESPEKVTQPYSVIALLTCEGAAAEEGMMMNAILYRARQIGAQGVIVLPAERPGLTANLLFAGNDRRVFRANAIVYAAAETPKASFNDEEFAAYVGSGSSTISGQALLKTKGGDTKFAAGNEVLLCPVTPYSTEYYEKQIVRDQRLQPPDERILRHFRKTVADGRGEFVFKDLPAGDYFLGCKITWQIEGKNGLETTGGIAYGKVKVGPGETAKVVLTR